MKRIHFPYGKTSLSHEFKEDELAAVLSSSINDFQPASSGEELVRLAIENPIGSDRLCDLAVNKKKIVIIASDHTRPVPSKIIMPALLKEIRSKNPDADITILIATGCHRGTTKDELIDKFGEEIVKNENICIHDCDDQAMLTGIGTLPSGGECEISKLAYEADLLVSEGFIEPHFFAGFSGGRKSVLPGVAGRKTVLSNHCSKFIDNPNSRTGILENNPIHADMLWAAKKAGLDFILNVVLNEEKKIIHAVAGDCEKAHEAGVRFLTSLCGVPKMSADVVITTNGGYPLDQNIYQAVKGMTAAEAVVKPGGVIIMIAASSDGVGGDYFYHQLADEENIHKTIDIFRKRDKSETVPDQWQAQILIRILMHAKVIYISEMPDDTIENMHMIPAHSIPEAIELSKEILRKEDVKIVAIPDGVSVIVSSQES